VLYLIIFDLIFYDLINISELNISLFQSTIWMNNIVSSLVSMRYVFNYTLNEYPIKYNSFNPNINEYFETLRENSFVWYKNIITNFGFIEQNIDFYFEGNNDVFWKNIPVSYPGKGLNKDDSEAFPLSIANVLSEINELLKNEFFSVNHLMNIRKSQNKLPKNYIIDSNNNNFSNNSTTENTNNNNNYTNNTNNTYDTNNNTGIKYMNDIEYNQTNLTEIQLVKIEYSGFLSIENSINNLLPKMLELLYILPNELQSYNKSDMRFIIIIIVAYGFSLLILMFIYSICLYLTNKNMQEGLEKVCRIKLPSIEETIKRIELFNEKCLSKYRIRDSNPLTVDRDEFDENQKENNKNNNDNKFRNYGEGTKYKSLKILSFSYLQVLIIVIIISGILIPIYLISYGMINDSNKILSVQNYIFGKSLTASASTVFIKCMISVCKTENDFNYKMDFIDRTKIENVIRDITQFTQLSEFYNNKYLLNACLVIHNDKNTIEYKNCMSDSYIQSANNTDSLLKLVEETVDTISKDKDIKIGKPYLFGSNETIQFTNPLLFETGYYKDLEYVFYNFITPISDNFAKVVSSSLNNYLLNCRDIIIILISIFGLILFLFSSYIAFVFTNKLIHLLSVSRCIFRIIPTSVINNTAELETWIENKY